MEDSGQALKFGGTSVGGNNLPRQPLASEVSAPVYSSYKPLHSNV
jgi:hypothetical protein